MSDMTNEVQNEDVSKKKKKEKKKGGFWGKFFCLVLGFFFGVCSVFGAVAGGAYFVVSRPIDETVNTIDEMTGANLYGTLFGTTDENGNQTAGILNEKYAEGKIIDLLGDVGDAIGNLSSKDASLAGLNEISPKVGSAIEGVVDSLSAYGINLDAQELLNTPFKGENGLAEYFKGSLSNIAAGDLLQTLGGEDLSPMFLSICYGKENVDYTIDEDGNVKMLGDAKKKTIGELTSTDISTLFDDILLCDVMGLEENYENGVIMHLMYGVEDVNYKLNVKDGKPAVEMQNRSVYKTASGATVIYNEHGRVMENVSVDTEARTFTDTDGMVYNYRGAGKKKVNGVNCDILALCDDKGEYLKFAPTSIGDLMGDDNAFESLMHTMTISEFFDEELLQENLFLKHLQHQTIESLPDSIAHLKVVDVYADKVYEADGVTLKGSWRYLLTDPKTHQADTSITVTDMETMIVNMQDNIHFATLSELKEDGVLTELSDSMLNTQLKTSVAGISLGVSFPGKTKLGELTIEEMLTYLDALLKKI